MQETTCALSAPLQGIVLAEQPELPKIKAPKLVEFEVETALGTYIVTVMPGNPITKCMIMRNETIYIDAPTDLVSFGIGVCKHGDPYNWELGMRMAIRSAMRMIEDPSVHTAIWAAYLEQYPVAMREQVAVKVPAHHPSDFVVKITVSDDTFRHSCEAAKAAHNKVIQNKQ